MCSINPIVKPSRGAIPLVTLTPASKMAGADGDDSLYPIAVLIDELRNEDVQVIHSTGPALVLEAVFSLCEKDINRRRS